MNNYERQGDTNPIANREKTKKKHTTAYCRPTQGARSESPSPPYPFCVCTTGQRKQGEREYPSGASPPDARRPRSAPAAASSRGGKAAVSVDAEEEGRMRVYRG
jgi:hypothetical protein